MVEYIRICASNLEEIKNLERCPLVSDESGGDETSAREALIIEVNDTYFYVTEFLNVLYNLAVSDETKHEIYETYRMRDYLDVFIENGNVTEREYALKLLWQLCFDKRVARHVAADHKLVARLKHFKELKDNAQNRNSIKCASGVLWLLDVDCFVSQQTKRNRII